MYNVITEGRVASINADLNSVILKVDEVFSDISNFSSNTMGTGGGRANTSNTVTLRTCIISPVTIALERFDVSSVNSWIWPTYAVEEFAT